MTAIDWPTEAFGFRQRAEHRHTDQSDVTVHARTVAAGATLDCPLADVEATGMRLRTAEDPEGHRRMFGRQLAAAG